MSLEIGIYKAKQITLQKENSYYKYDIAPRLEFENNHNIPYVNELHWQKFWELHCMIWNRHEKDLAPEILDNGVDIILTKEDMEEILYFITHNVDYFETFHNVYEIANILYYWDEYVKHGVIWIYNGSY